MGKRLVDRASAEGQQGNTMKEMDEFAKYMKDMRNVSCDGADLRMKISQNGWTSLDEIQGWIKEKGYTLYQTAKQEFILHKQHAYCHIVLRNLYGELFIAVESTEDIAEAVPDRMALGLSLVNPTVYSLWCNYRNNSTTENAICTRYMPSIVAQLLMLVHHIEDQDIVHAFLCRLAPFGTKHFGVRDFNISGYVENVRTPYHICYAPGELEAITDVSADILRNVNSADDVKAIDMNRFKEMLREKTAGIAPTPDIAFFGRKLNGSGLEEFECPIQLSMPIRLG